MFIFLTILLLGIVGANAQCTDGGRVSCYVALYMNNDINDKQSLCNQLPLTQQCVNNTGCPMDKLDNYLESLIKSCDTPCDLFESIKCSKSFKVPKENRTFCQALDGIKKCYSSNKCEHVMNENPTFFHMCDNPNDKVDEKTIWRSGRLRNILEKVKKTLKEKREQPKSTELPLSTELPTGN